MSAPSISVIIAAYNAADTIGAQLRALAAQTFTESFEILVCDNGSTDGTADVVKREASGLPELRLVDASAIRGPGAARNVGAAQARGENLAFCDADDVVDPAWLAAIHAGLGEATFVAGRGRRLEFNARPGSADFFSWGVYRIPFFPHLRSAGAGNMGVRTDAFLAIGGFDVTLRTGEDLDLCWRMQLAGHELVEVAGAVVAVSNRTGLGSTIAQTYAYGVGDRRLAHKYALVDAAYRDAQHDAHARPVVARGVSEQRPRRSQIPSIVSKAWRKVTSIRRLSDLTTIARRVSTALGFRFGRIDPSAPQVVPPAVLPRPEPR